MRAFWFLIALSLFLSAAAGSSQQERQAEQVQQTQQAQQPQQPQQEAPPRFRAEVSAVLVDVLVLDGQGEPIAGLTREDFQVLEDGVRQEIDSFEVIDWTSYVARVAPQGETAAPQPGPAAAVNAFPRRFVFIINRQSASSTYIRRAKMALENFVVESMADGDEALIIDMGFSTKVLQQFRDSKAETLRTIRQLSLLEVDLYAGTGSDLGTRNVYETLESLGQSLGQLPGRKIVIFLSPQLEQTENYLNYLQDTVDAFNQSNASIYSINIGGLGGVSAATDESAAVSSSRSFAIGGLFPLANETGGRYYYNLETFEPALRRVGQENRRYYLISYTPSNTNYDGEFRSIEVRVDRPNVEVVARRGYMARKDRAPLTTDAAPPKPPAVAEQEPSRGEPVPPRAANPASPAERVPSGPSPPDQLEITTYLFPAGNEVDVPITVALPLDLLSADGELVERRLKLAVIDSVQGTVAEFTERVDARSFFVVRSPKLAPGLYLLQLTVEDASGKQLHQSSTPLEVPEGFGDRFGFSSIVPVFAPSAAASGQAQPIEIRPTPRLPRGEDAYLYFRIFQGEDAGSLGDDTELAYVIHRDGLEVASGAHTTPLRLSSADERGFPVVLRLPTSELPPGLYRVTLRISSSSLGRRASTEVDLTID